MSIKNKMKDFFGLEEDPNSTYEEEYTVANAAAPSTTETSVVRQDDRPKSANNLVALNTKRKIVQKSYWLSRVCSLRRKTLAII